MLDHILTHAVTATDLKLALYDKLFSSIIEFELK